MFKEKEARKRIEKKLNNALSEITRMRKVIEKEAWAKAIHTRLEEIGRGKGFLDKLKLAIKIF